MLLFVIAGTVVSLMSEKELLKLIFKLFRADSRYGIGLSDCCVWMKIVSISPINLFSWSSIMAFKPDKDFAKIKKVYP